MLPIDLISKPTRSCGSTSYMTEDGRELRVLPADKDDYFERRVVLLNGERIGSITTTSAYVERRPRGSRIVTSRHSRDEYRYVADGDGRTLKNHWDPTSLWRTVEDLLNTWLREQERKNA
jgi:hypothetical protein